MKSITGFACGDRDRPRTCAYPCSISRYPCNRSRICACGIVGMYSTTNQSRVAILGPLNIQAEMDWFQVQFAPSCHQSLRGDRAGPPCRPRVAPGRSGDAVRSNDDGLDEVGNAIESRNSDSRDHRRLRLFGDGQTASRTPKCPHTPRNLLPPAAADIWPTSPGDVRRGICSDVGLRPDDPHDNRVAIYSANSCARKWHRRVKRVPAT
jgi:hypothetical protein